MISPLKKYYKYFEFEGSIVAQKFKKGTVVHIKNGVETILPFTKIIDCTHLFIRAVYIKDSLKKWGIIHNNGTIILPPNYDYIPQPIHHNYIKVFIGNFSWEQFDANSAELFYNHIDQHSWNGDMYEATLNKGLWGIVSTQNKVIVPIEYNWVEFFSTDVFLYNVDGSNIIRWFSGDDKKRQWAIVDGYWGVLGIENLQNSKAYSMDYLIKICKQIETKIPFNMAYHTHTIGKYFSEK